MRETCPAASKALGTRFLVAILICAYLPLATGTSNCRISKDINVATVRVDKKTRYCEPSAGCTYIEEYGDCIRDNETPNCIYYSYIPQVCQLCYQEKEQSKGTDIQWKEAPNPSIAAQAESQKVPSGAKVCDKVLPT